MDVLMEIESHDLEGVMGKEFIQRGICPDLSLGYHVTMSKSPAGFLRATNKKVVELSIVRQGARDGCKIRAFSNGAMAGAKRSAAELFGSSSKGEPVSDNTAAVAPSADKRHRILA